MRSNKYIVDVDGSKSEVEGFREAVSFAMLHMPYYEGKVKIYPKERGNNERIN